MEDNSGCGGCLGCMGSIIGAIAAFYAAAIAIGIAAAGVGIFILAFIIFPFLAYWLIFGLFFNRLRKNLNEALVTIQNLIFEAENIVRGQYLTSQSNLQSFNKLQLDCNLW